MAVYNRKYINAIEISKKHFIQRNHFEFIIAQSYAAASEEYTFNPTTPASDDYDDYYK